MKRVILIIFVLYITPLTSLPAQWVQPHRYEVELGLTDKSFLVIPCQEEGIGLVRERQATTDGKKFWEVIMLDTALGEAWKRNIVLDDQNLLRGYDYDLDKLYLLFAKNNYSQIDYLMITLDRESGDYIIKEFEMIVNVALTEFEILNNKAIFGGAYNQRPVVLLMNLNDAKMQVIPGLYNEFSELIHLNIQHQFSRFQVITTHRLRDKRFTISIKSYNSEGNLMWEHQIDPPDDLNIIYGRVIPLKNGNVQMVGTYSNNNSSFSRGVISTELSPEGIQETNIYNYADFENFFSYMKPKREKRIRKKIERKRNKGKEMKLNYRLIVHDIIDRGDGYIVLGEAFYPKYNSHTQNFAGGYVNERVNQYFEGYQYTHSVIMGFDGNGNMTWDNSFEISDVLSFELEQFVHINPNDTSLEMALHYLYNNQISTKIIRKQEVIEGPLNSEIKPLYEHDEIKTGDDSEEMLAHWYDDFFHVSGVQRIRNVVNEEINTSRRVFFINKITYR